MNIIDFKNQNKARNIDDIKIILFFSFKHFTHFGRERKKNA